MTPPQKMNEASPMISPVRTERIESNGAIEMSSPDGYDYTPRRGYFQSRFNHVYGLLFVVALIMLAVLVLCIILVTRLSKVEGQYASASKQFEQIPLTIEKMAESFRAQHSAFLSPGGMGSDASLPRPEGDPVKADVHGPETTRRKPQETHGWHDPTCQGLGQCDKEGFEKPPLVLLSFDGFSREYLDRGIVKSLQFLADCGATAERVIPSFPSRTFPNHYTIVTGLYPESHGVVDNNVYDPALSPWLENMKSTKIDAFYKGDPIWSQYMRETQRPTACLFWPGCPYNVSGFPPTVAPPYNKDLPFRNRFDQVIEWLNQPSSTRPGLITVYFDQPDTIGHYQKDQADVDHQLNEMDRLMDQFLSTLRDQGLLECINLVVVSDHGMHRINKTIYYEDFLDLTNVISTKGVVGRLHRKTDNISIASLSAPFECRRSSDLRLFTRESMPPRKHYSRDARVGDVVLQGELGTAFYDIPSSDYHLSADHGFDFIHDSMHTIFFARGPGIKPKSRLPAFQNVEYLNLFKDLLGLSAPTYSNGTLGFMDPILAKAPERKSEPKQHIRECPLSLQLPGAFGCGNCSATNMEAQSKKLLDCSTNMADFRNNIPQFTTTRDVCFENYCGKTRLTGQGKDNSQAVIEVLTKEDKLEADGCQISNRKYVNFDRKCNETEGRFLSAHNKTDFARIISTKFAWSQGFIDTVLDPLDRLTHSYVNSYEKMVVVTGTAYDRNIDGIADDTQSGLPSHLYRLLVRCPSGWANNGFCEDSTKMETLAFIFPTSLDKDVNCLTSDQLLLEYTARIRDVELISGMELLLRDVTVEEQLRIRTRISMQLW